MPSPPTTQTILITGATRGLGRGLTAHYLARPSTTVIACIRAPTSPAALSLHTLPTGPSSRLLLLPMDAASEPSVTAALATLPTHGIDTLTLVIANAAAAGPVGGYGGGEEVD
ncbi:putative aflatoxin biosynthesis ketoreductase nor-1 protein [Neofusicoccum parvum UCRNP2]|uniref:Putative aflatoxin biosynthesis ketoreductase nor-1 protein n=1 Tax=Botryosphaeria parva (strain UCR-NP2) TaxID=1287680 RepID=R1G1V8_BOTPV|nr:putative aflatoxin biosynthesis ketoreductase nor-1 protein [Neofusicoccum parvum UCRNP2]